LLLTLAVEPLLLILPLLPFSAAARAKSSDRPRLCP